MKAIAVTEFKANCLALLDDVARTGEPLVVTKRGKPLARVVPSGSDEAAYPQSSLAGTVTIVGDAVGPVLPASAWNAVRGELLTEDVRPVRSGGGRDRAARYAHPPVVVRGVEAPLCPAAPRLEEGE